MYTLKSQSEGQLVFGQARFTSIMYWILVLIAVPSLLAGFAVLSMEADETGFIFTGIGLVFLMGAFVLKKNKESFAKQLIFNHKEGLMQFIKGKDSTAIPYSNLSGFDFTYIRNKGHIVYAKREDGSLLDIVVFGSSFGDKDQKLTELLNSTVDINKESYYEVPMPKWLNKLDRSPDTVFYWKENQSFTFLLMFVVILLGFTISFGATSEIAVYILGGLSTLLILYLIFSYIRSKTNWAVLKISPYKVEYGYAKHIDDVFTHLWQSKKEINREELVDSRYSLDLTNGEHLSFMLLTEEDRKMIDSIRDGSFDYSQIISMFRKNMSLFKIRFINNTVIDLLDFERILKKELFKN